jgi:hypothetical protein
MLLDHIPLHFHEDWKLEDMSEAQDTNICLCSHWNGKGFVLNKFKGAGPGEIMKILE